MHIGGLRRFFWEVALASIVMTSGLFVWSVLLLFIGLTLTQWHFLLTPLLSLLLLKLFTHRDTDPFTWGGLVFCYLFFVISLSLLGWGMGLHWTWAVADRGLQTELLLQFAHGWNPYHEAPLRLSEAGVGSAKAGAIFESVYYLFAGHYEYAKVHNIWFILLQLLMAPFFFKSLRPESRGFGNFWAPILLTLNPVLIAQVWTGCMDALLVCGLQMLIMLGAVYCMEEGARNRGWVATTFILLLIFTVNISTWSIFAVLALMIPLILWQIFSQNKKVGVLSALGILISFVVAVAVFGFDPYMKNIIEHGSMLYPLSQQALLAETPAFIQKLNPVQQFLYATLARPASDIALATLPDPLYFFALQDPQAYLHPDPRLRGFGILWPFILPLTLGLVLASFLPGRNRDSRQGILWLIIAQLLLMTFMTPGNWWARLVGFLWMLVVVMIHHSVDKGFFRRTTAALLLVLVLVNSGHYIAHSWPLQMRFSSDVEAYMGRITSGELPDDIDAQRANTDHALVPKWMELKRKGEGDIPEKALLPKVEALKDDMLHGRNLWEIQKDVVKSLDRT